MRFVNRLEEIRRLEALRAPALAVLWGRRRVGKTRLLTDWIRVKGGIYAVADASAEAIQRSYFAAAVAAHVPGFADVSYPDWRSLLGALAREAERGALLGPVVIDEVPYLIESCPSLPSVLQNFVDHEGKRSRVLLVLAGSSQRMMQGLALDSTAPLFGRAREALELRPLLAGYLGEALSVRDPMECIRSWSVWGGIPWYWELAEPFGRELEQAVDSLVLDPSGPLHTEPDRLLMEEQPGARALRPLLDAIGGGAHRLSEIAGRVGQPTTSLSRPIARLLDLHLVHREQPFGDSERSGKRALYKIDDPFFRMWFRVVAPHRGLLAASTPRVRRELWRRLAPGLVAQAWECLCRLAIPRLPAKLFGGAGPWGAAGRSWQRSGPEWDVVAENADRSEVLLGEVKWMDRPATASQLERSFRELVAKGTPELHERRVRPVVRAVFVPKCAAAIKQRGREFFVIDGRDVLAALR